MSKFAEIAPRIWAGVATEEEMAAFKSEDVYAMKSDQDHIHYRFASHLKAVNKETRSASYVASTETRDRSGDIVVVKGWKLDGFAKNPQFLMEHMPSFGPLGLVPEIRKGNYNGSRALLAEVSVHEEDKLGDHARLRSRLVLDGDVVGMSVGFIPLDPYRPKSDEERKTIGLGPYGIHHRSQELFELSSVLVPDNADAVQKRLASMVAAGECSESLAREVQRGWLPSTRTIVPVAKVFDDLAAEDETKSEAAPIVAELTLGEEVPSLADKLDAIQAQLDALKSNLSADLAALKSTLESTRAASSPASPTRDPQPEAESAKAARATNPRGFYGAALAAPFLRYPKKGNTQ